jgi:acyl carrier protein
MNMNTRERVRDFVAELLRSKGDGTEIQILDSDSLLLSGRLQSIDAVEIAMFLEQEYRVDFSEVGFDQAQLDSIDQIAELAERFGQVTG